MRRALTGPLSFGLSKAIASPEGVGVPAWVLSGAALDLDFAEVQGYNSLDRSKLTPDSILTYTSPSPKMVHGDDGVLFSSSGTLPYDHDPVTFAPLGVLIEEQRTNLLTYSEQFDNVAWVKTRSSISANAIAAPDGTTTADKLVEDTTGSSTHSALQTTSVTSGLTYTHSVFVKAAERSRIFLQLTTTRFPDACEAAFNLATGVIVSTGVGAVSAEIQYVGNGWYRCSVTGLCDSTGSTNFITYLDNGGSTSYTGDGTSGLYLWGAQLEAGAFPTSYIPTVASQVTRAADQVSVLTSAFAYNHSAGTVVVEGDPIVRASGASGFFAINISGGNNDTYNLYRAATTDELQIRSGGSTVAPISIAGPTGVDKFAVGWMVDDFAISKNGAAVSTDTAGALPVGVTTLQIGTVAGGNYANGHIERLTYFPTRKTNAELQVLST